MKRTLKYRLYPSKRQAALLEAQLDATRELYNAALQERREAWKLQRVSISKYDQTYQLKEIFANEWTGIKGYSCAWHVLDRADKAFDHFFRRIKQKGIKAGFPRFKSKNTWDSFEWSVQPRHKPLKGDKLSIPRLGLFKIKLHRPCDGKLKHIVVKQIAGKWYTCLSVEVETAPLPESCDTVGLDVGLKSFVTFSDGSQIDNPRYYQKAQKKLRRAQRRVARRKKGGNSRRKAVLLLQKAHERVRNTRNDFHHKISRDVVNRFGLIAAEDLNIKGLAGGILAKSVTDAGWGNFLNQIAYKAESAGRVFIQVNPNGTSQNCSGCGVKVAKTLSERTHKCEACGLVLDRDHNAALNILGAGVALSGRTWAVTSSVPDEKPLSRNFTKARISS